MQEYTTGDDTNVTDDVRARFIRAMRWLNDPRSYLAPGVPGVDKRARLRRRSRPTAPWPTCIRIVTAA